LKVAGRYLKVAGRYLRVAGKILYSPVNKLQKEVNTSVPASFHSTH
jgi:hypothetical protein